MADQNFDETFDFVIVGSGGGSMAAALYLHSIGKRAIVLEKTDKIGGSTAMSAGLLWVPNNPLMAREGVPDSEEAARRYLDATIGMDAGPAASPARKDAFIKAGPQLVSFLERIGIPFVRAGGWADYYDDRDGGSTPGRAIAATLFDSREMGPLFDKLRLGPMILPVRADRTRSLTLATRTLPGMITGALLLARLWLSEKRGKPILSYGGALQGRMIMLSDRAGIPIRTETGVIELIEAGGRIVGVAAENKGKQTRIGASGGVLINAGGFARNAAMRKKYQPQPSSVEWTNANPGDTGEMIEIAQKHGAAIDLMNEAWWVPGTSPVPGQPAFMHVLDLSKPHCIVVNRHGRRVLNESQSYMENGQTLYRHDVPAFVIMESRHRERYSWGSQPPGGTPPEWESSGYMKKADTIEELARKCGIDPQGLKSEIEKFNGFARAGKDLDFHRGDRGYDNWFGDPTVKPNPNLGAIEKAPFYGFEMVPGDVGTAGGILTDEYARALREDGSVIEGLYATGNSTASVFGRCYPAPGASIAASFVYAYIAAHHAFGRATALGFKNAEA